MISTQWFVKMDTLAKPAADAVRDGRIKFVPERFTKIYCQWLDNIRDWCISRQLWWGQRIPAYYLPDGSYVVEATPEAALKAAQAINPSLKAEGRRTGKADNGIVTADAGYDGLQSVTVAVPQPQGSTSTVIRENTTTVVDVTDYESISILTDVPAPALSLQTKTAVTNGYVTFDTGYDGLQGVNVAVPLPQGSTSVTITENTTTNVDVTDYESISVVTAVPSVQKWVGTTAQYQALAPNYDENTLYLTTD